MMKVPPLDNKALKDFLDQLLLELDKTEKDSVSSVTANASLLLLSPSKKVFQITVSDAGALTIVKVQG
jgi:hypothetical protein